MIFKDLKRIPFGIRFQGWATRFGEIANVTATEEPASKTRLKPADIGISTDDEQDSIAGGASMRWAALSPAHGSRPGMTWTDATGAPTTGYRMGTTPHRDNSKPASRQTDR